MAVSPWPIPSGPPPVGRSAWRSWSGTSKVPGRSWPGPRRAADALVAALVGYRSAGKLDVVPEVPERDASGDAVRDSDRDSDRDAEGIPMAIRYWRAPASEPGG